MSGLTGIFATDLLPILLIAAVGYLLARRGGVQVTTMSSVAFHALLPCLIFHMLVTSTIRGRDVVEMAVAATLITGAMGLVGALAVRVLQLSRVDSSAFLIVVMFSNSGNYGLPLVSFAFGAAALTYATVFFITGSVIMFTVGGLIAAAGSRPLGQALRDLLKMPMIYAAVVALIVIGTGVSVPAPLMRPIGLLSDAALPMMILILGMQLRRAVMPKRPGVSVMAVAVSLVITPLVAMSIASLLGITGPARQAVIILSSMPVAVSTTILAIQYDIDPELVTSAVFLSTILSPLTLVPLIAWLS